MRARFPTSHRKKDAVQQKNKIKKNSDLCFLVGERGDEGHGSVPFVLTFQLKEELMLKPRHL